jgi:hypothetical protein
MQSRTRSDLRNSQSITRTFGAWVVLVVVPGGFYLGHAGTGFFIYTVHWFGNANLDFTAIHTD